MVDIGGVAVVGADDGPCAASHVDRGWSSLSVMWPCCCCMQLLLCVVIGMQLCSCHGLSSSSVIVSHRCQVGNGKGRGNP